LRSITDDSIPKSTIITVLPRPEHVKSVFEEMLEPSTDRADASSRLFIDCSTIDPSTSATVADATRITGQGIFVDAPMSGGVVGAAAGKLTFMIGAAPEHVSRATAVLSLMGARVVHMGPQTSGLKAKLANNYLLALNNIATAEAMNMGVRWGLDPVVLANMINSATGRCWPSEVNNPVPGVVATAPASRDYAGGFGAGLMLKDLNLALQAAEEVDVTPQLGLQARQIYEAVEADENLKGKDFSVVYRYFGGIEGGQK
jgi:3-hydroxyisobutyrate dehydrogenase